MTSHRPTTSLRAIALSLLMSAALLAGLTAAPAPALASDSNRQKQYWLSSSGITEAWKFSQGEGVKVAIIDSGIDATHPDLRGAVIGGTDVSGAGSSNGQKGIGRTPEHGTLVATLLAGRGHRAPASSPAPRTSRSAAATAPTARAAATDAAPAVGAGPDGIIGVAPKAQLLSVSAWIGSDNPAGIPIEDQIPKAVRWAVDQGAGVINMSLGSSSTAWPQSWDEAFLYAEQKDVVIVAAAGNRGVGIVQVGAPATIPGVLTVAGLDRNGKASWDSSSQGISIGVAAPAEKLVGGLPGGLYADWSGTSGAAPLVAGVAALIRSEYPELSAADVINRIISTAKDGGVAGQDPIYGYGILDAQAALAADVPAVAANPLGTIADWIRVHRRGNVTPTVRATATKTQDNGPQIPEPTVPVAVEPVVSSDALPATIVFGFGGLILLVIGLGVYQAVRVRRDLLANPLPEEQDTGTFPAVD